MSMADTSWTLPLLQMANLLVPPPMSMFKTTPPDFRRMGYRARTMGSHRRFKAVAGADRDELTGFLGEQLADGAGVAPPHGNAGENQCAGIDLFAANLGDLVLVVDERSQASTSILVSST